MYIFEGIYDSHDGELMLTFIDRVCNVEENVIDITSLFDNGSVVVFSGSLLSNDLSDLLDYVGSHFGVASNLIDVRYLFGLR